VEEWKNLPIHASNAAALINCYLFVFRLERMLTNSYIICLPLE